MAGGVMKGTGLVHIYCGDGKGKTSAGMGLCLRAAGYGYRVLICQFLKDNASSERSSLKSVPGITLMENPEKIPFSFQMDDEEKRRWSVYCHDLLREAFRTASVERYDVLFLDEAVYAVRAGLLDEEQLLLCIREKPSHLEVILTGREPGEKLVALADYVSEIRKIKHPYDCGQPARFGIEK